MFTAGSALAESAILSHAFHRTMAGVPARVRELCGRALTLTPLRPSCIPRHGGWKSIHPSNQNLTGEVI
jgi:hypothetical protein